MIGMSCFGNPVKSSLRIYDQSCSALNRRLMWFSRRMLLFGSASKNWNQLLCAPLDRTHPLLLRPQYLRSSPARTHLLRLRPRIRPWMNQQNTLFLICLIQSLVSHSWVILLQTRRGGRSFSPIMTWMPLPRFCSLDHQCPLPEFVMMSLNTGQHEVEGVSDIHLSFLGPRSRQIRFIANNRYL